MIERTFDYRKIKKLVSCQPIITDKIIYLIDGDCGLWVLHEYLDGLMIHVEMQINSRGKEAIKKGRNAMRWVFDNLKIKVIYANIPKTNKPSCHNARRIGMEFVHEKDDMRFYAVHRETLCL